MFFEIIKTTEEKTKKILKNFVEFSVMRGRGDTTTPAKIIGWVFKIRIKRSRVRWVHFLNKYKNLWCIHRVCGPETFGALGTMPSAEEQISPAFPSGHEAVRPIETFGEGANTRAGPSAAQGTL